MASWVGKHRSESIFTSNASCVSIFFLLLLLSPFFANWIQNWNKKWIEGKTKVSQTLKFNLVNILPSCLIVELMEVEIDFYFLLFSSASIHSAATPIGSLASVPIMDAYGRKNALLLSVAPLIAGWSSIALAESHAMILAGRIICGIAVGLMSAPAQVSSTCIYN